MSRQRPRGHINIQDLSDNNDSQNDDFLNDDSHHDHSLNNASDNDDRLSVHESHSFVACLVVQVALAEPRSRSSGSLSVLVAMIKQMNSLNDVSAIFESLRGNGEQFRRILEASQNLLTGKQTVNFEHYGA